MLSSGKRTKALSNIFRSKHFSIFLIAVTLMVLNLAVNSVIFFYFFILQCDKRSLYIVRPDNDEWIKGFYLTVRSLILILPIHSLSSRRTVENSGQGADRFNEIKALQQIAFALKSDAAVGFFF